MFEPRPAIITFDCYGTLIDWSSGVLAQVEELLARGGLSPSEFFRVWWGVDRRLTIDGGYRPYGEILKLDFYETFQELGLGISEDRAAVMARSLGSWPPFPDTSAALSWLRAKGYKLGILSNIEDDLLAQSIGRIGVEFDLIVTAQQVRSYKPAPAHFQTALERLGLPPSRICHAAASLMVDVVPAKALGLRTVLVKRNEPDADHPVTPDITVTSLEELARRM